MIDPPRPAAELRQVLIIGGGVSGLAAAYELRDSGLECTLLEASGRLGGVISTENVEGCLVEGGPDSFIAQKPWALELIRELGLGDEVIGSNDSLRRTYILRDGRLIALPDGIQFLAPTKILPLLETSLLSPRTKLTMALEWFRRPSPAQDDRSVAEFVKDHYGDEANEYLAQPMLAGVYGGSPEQLSVDSVLPRFVELERKYGSLSRALFLARWKQRRPSGAASPLFLTLRGGMQTLIDALEQAIRGRVRVALGAQAQVVRRAEGRFEVEVANADPLRADRVIIATPAWRAAELLQGQDPSLAEQLGAIAYGSCVTGALVYRRPEFTHPLDGFGFLVPRAENRTLSACTWVNTKFNDRTPADKPLLRAFIAGDKADAHLAATDAELAGRVGGELQQIMGFAAQPVASSFSRWRRSMAQYQVGHARVVGRIEELLRQRPGLYLSGNGYDGIGVPDCIRRSRAAARDILQQTAGPATVTSPPASAPRPQ
ncbi:MAG: protoporphyrinogen oxidase [Acidobacteria bacterium]|nr:protoporphyrinogen oxidase [Acidobacteriota bacterium]